MQALHHGDFPIAALLADKRGQTVSACLPAKDCAATVEAIVTTLSGG